MENPTNQNVQQSEVITRQTNQEDRQVRWAFNQDQTETTRFETNQGEFSMTLIQDNTMDSESRNQHDMMLQSIGLKLTNQYRQYVIDERAKRFIDFKIYKFENLERRIASNIKSNFDYIKEYSEMYDITIEESENELSKYLMKIDNLRKIMVQKFF
jgi:hypothetical protein